jgi:uncharacterized membrane protein HdeD (DUF308 family)
MTFSTHKWVVGALAIVAGLLCIFWFDMARWVIGIFLIVWGILTLLHKQA